MTNPEQIVKEIMQEIKEHKTRYRNLPVEIRNQKLRAISFYNQLTSFQAKLSGIILAYKNELSFLSEYYNRLKTNKSILIENRLDELRQAISLGGGK